MPSLHVEIPQVEKLKLQLPREIYHQPTYSILRKNPPRREGRGLAELSIGALKSYLQG
jgi:hypothetical protein